MTECCVEPSEIAIVERMKATGASYYEAREALREEAYRANYDKPEGMSWGDFWKSY